MQTRGPNLVLETVAAKQPVISGAGATRSLNELESGSVVLFDRAAGITYTLPLAKPGTFFDFITTVAKSAGGANIIAANITAGTQFVTGPIQIAGDTAGGAGVSSVSTFTPNETSHYALSMNGTTTGMDIGSRIRLTALSSGTWHVSGLLIGTGVLATPFTATP